MWKRKLNSRCLSRTGRALLIFALIAVPSAAVADTVSYRGTLQVMKSSGGTCASDAKGGYAVEVVLDSDGSGVEGYLHGRDLSTGHFRGQDLDHLQVSYPLELAEPAELSLQQMPMGLSGELREKHLPSTSEDCHFDSARLTLTRESARDGATAWKEGAARWQIELLNRRTFDFVASGNLAKAVEAAERSLQLCDRHFGSDSAESSTPLSNLAVVYRRLGRYEEAETLCKRVLAVAEKTLGPEHPKVAIRLVNLAELYENTGRKSQAEPLYQRALTIYEKALGPEHPEVAKVLNNLAVLYESFGRYREAEPLLLRALRIAEKAYGPEHASVATLRRNLEKLRKKLPPPLPV